MNHDCTPACQLGRQSKNLSQKYRKIISTTCSHRRNQSFPPVTSLTHRLHLCKYWGRAISNVCPFWEGRPFPLMIAMHLPPTPKGFLFFHHFSLFQQVLFPTGVNVYILTFTSPILIFRVENEGRSVFQEDSPVL